MPGHWGEGGQPVANVAVDLDALAARAEAYRVRGIGPAIEEACDQMLEAARAAGASEYELTALRLIGTSRLQVGEVREGLEMLRQAEALAAGRPGHPETFKVAYNLAVGYRKTGELAKARDYARDAVALLPPELYPNYRAMALLLQASVAKEAQAWDEALRLCKEAEAAVDPADRRRMSSVWNHYGTIYAAMKQVRQAEEALTRAISFAGADKPYWLAYSYTELGWVALQRGAVAEATQQANRALALFLANAGHLDRLEVARISHLYGAVAWADDDSKEAARHLTRARRYYRSAGSPYEAEARALAYEVEMSQRRTARTDYGGKRNDLEVLSAILDLGDRIEDTHPSLRGHAERVAHYAVLGADRLGLNDVPRAWLLQAARLHDAGLLTINPMLLDNPGRLPPGGEAALREQPARGAEIVASARLAPAVVQAVRHHHEHFDGAGGPDGVAGERISLLSRIIHVAETYDALTSKRPHRPSYSHTTTLAMMRSESGARLCPTCLDAFIHSIEAPSEPRKEVSA